MFIDVDNYNIYYEILGDKNPQFDCLLIHGWGTDLYSLRLTSNILSKKYRVYSIDLPGFGKSDKLKESFTVDDYTNIVIHFIEKIGIKNVCLVGHSYGGRIIIKMNNRTNLSFNIKQNVLIDSAGIKHKQKNSMRTYTYKFLKKLYMFLPISKEAQDKKIDELKKRFGSIDYRNADGVLRDTLVKSVNEDLSEEIKNIKAKTLIIWGDKDTATPISDAKYLNENIKDSELYIINGAGHFPFVDSPFEYENILKMYFDIR